MNLLNNIGDVIVTPLHLIVATLLYPYEITCPSIEPKFIQIDGVTEGLACRPYPNARNRSQLKSNSKVLDTPLKVQLSLPSIGLQLYQLKNTKGQKTEDTEQQRTVCRARLLRGQPCKHFTYGQCDQIGQFIALRATFQSLWQQLFCQNCPHF